MINSVDIFWRILGKHFFLLSKCILTICGYTAKDDNQCRKHRNIHGGILSRTNFHLTKIHALYDLFSFGSRYLSASLGIIIHKVSSNVKPRKQILVLSIGIRQLVDSLIFPKLSNIKFYKAMSSFNFTGYRIVQFKI